MDDQLNNDGQNNQGYQSQQTQQQQPPPQYNPQYQYQYNQYNAPDITRPMTVGDYIVVMLIGIIPLVNLIMLFVWAFGSNVNINKRNYARAILIFILIGIVLWIFMISLFGFYFMNVFREFSVY